MFKLILVLFAVSVSNVPEVIAVETGHCILPPYPKNGVYTVDGNPSAKPGQILDAYVLKVTCDPGYHVDRADGDASCLQGWYYDLPACIPFCEWNTTGIVSCGVEQSTCYMDSCKSPEEEKDADCGRVIPLLRVIAGGRDADKQEVPWQAGIYSKLYSPYQQTCGGSLVSNTVVISAAHCFWDEAHQLPTAHYAVAVGKIYRPWNDPNDQFVQKSDVQEIHIPPLFLGSAANFQEDLALVVLKNAVHYSPAVRPICLDFDYAFDLRQLTPGALGQVSGWGLRAEDGRPSPILQVARMPYIGIRECVAEASLAFRAYLSGDKICAGYTNGTAVCKGDSGGGLAFPLDTAHGEKFYLRGVVSGAPQSDHLCSVYHWATFTHVLRHQHFIQALLVQKSKPIS